ncbi:alpha/beta hydrolase-fold protein [Streptomyces sp. NPDC049577]|uniref:alpha/beta hydrolase n=1 Tax=Streptomyces sp. NPDC049577 TaxID=3155153 RepID=UPI0034195AB5
MTHSPNGGYPPSGGYQQTGGRPGNGGGYPPAGGYRQAPPAPGDYRRPDDQYDPHGYEPHGYDRHDGPYGGYEPEPQGRRRGRTWLIVAACIAVLALVAGGVMKYMNIGPFSDKGKPVSFGQDQAAGGQAGGTTGGAEPADSKVLMPTGPAAEFKNANTMGDGTHIAVTTLDGKKSGFKGKVWVWAPKQYEDPKYKNSGFPVLIALPGGPGYPNNYWMGTDLGLESSIAKWSQEGKSLPFILAMPVLNPDAKYYYDGSDIPNQPKMGTWLTEDVPDLVKQNFRTLKSRDGWAFMGSSSGGFAGFKAVMKHPDKFKAVIASGPDIVPDSPLWKGHEAEMRENNPEVLSQRLIDEANAPKAPKSPKGAKNKDKAGKDKDGDKDVFIAFQYGTLEAAITRQGVDKYIATYGNKGPIHTHLEVIQGGKHDAKTYVKGMGNSSIQWISEHMEGPTPAS